VHIGGIVRRRRCGGTSGARRADLHQGREDGGSDHRHPRAAAASLIRVVRRPVRIHCLWHDAGNLRVLIPACEGELEDLPPGSAHAALLSWIVPEGGAESRSISAEELAQYLLHRQLEYLDETSGRSGVPSSAQAAK